MKTRHPALKKTTLNKALQCQKNYIVGKDTNLDKKQVFDRLKLLSQAN